MTVNNTVYQAYSIGGPRANSGPWIKSDWPTDHLLKMYLKISLVNDWRFCHRNSLKTAECAPVIQTIFDPLQSVAALVVVV